MQPSSRPSRRRGLPLIQPTQDTVFEQIHDGQGEAGLPIARMGEEILAVQGGMQVGGPAHVDPGQRAADRVCHAAITGLTSLGVGNERC